MHLRMAPRGVWAAASAIRTHWQGGVPFAGKPGHTLHDTATVLEDHAGGTMCSIVGSVGERRVGEAELACAFLGDRFHRGTRCLSRPIS
jgi:hypothetical protein